MLHESLRTHLIWNIGKWVRTDQCYKLEPADNTIVTKDITVATDDETRLQKGTQCKFLGWDSEGDVLLQEDFRCFVVFREDLYNRSLM